MEEASSSTRRRGRKAKGPFLDGKKIGLPDGWYYEQRPRTSVKYIGKIDQFYYEPGTNKQFRSIKEVNKHLESKQKKIQLTTPLALPENHRHNPETPPVVDLACDCGSNIPKKKRSIAAKQRGEISRNDHQELESPPAIDPTNDSGSNLPRKKRSVDTRKRREITWGFADAETGKRKNLDLNKISLY